MPLSRYLLLALVTILLVPGVHALRRRASLVYMYAVVAALAFAGWVIPHDLASTVGALTFGLASTVFFGAVLGGVFLLYVLDGPRAGRMGVAVVVGVGLLYMMLAALLNVLVPVGSGLQLLHLDSPRANAASLLASLLSLLLLGIVWEESLRVLSRLPLLLRVFATLLVVFEGDTLVYFPLAWWGQAGFAEAFEGSLASRLVLAALYAPVFTAYLWREIRVHGVKLAARPPLSIVTREDLERELLSARHTLRLGTEALWMSEEQYRRMVDDIPLFVCRFSREGLATYANRALCDHCDRPQEELLGMVVMKAIVPEERDQAWSRIQALTPSSPTTEMTLRTTSPAGGPRVERWVVRGIFSPNGASIAYQAIGADVTREIELEATARKAARIEGIAQLAGGVAHDFNNLMGVISSAASLAREELAKESPSALPATREALLDIGCATERAIALTRQLRAISRQEQVSPRLVDPSQAVAELTPLLRRLLPDTICLEMNCPQGLPRMLIDPSQLERVVVNLVVNARAAMPAGGQIRISVEDETLDGDLLRKQPGARPGRHILLTVRDSGEGMEEVVMRRIFEPFFTTRAALGGTGLGLATVNGIVQQAGGFVQVESEPGAGATFRVFLPATFDS